ncbi:hypothetical protein C2G38_2164643 [Gigaspora rosea]|uniref:Uncharacterized protein n=1 Tax=Gigaspora rosea TaxID=44941 RepID=A0A397VTT8_9GLOM|nr:hypothetical protein C2G38_2164643 [Gigaspora rosea]
MIENKREVEELSSKGETIVAKVLKPYSTTSQDKTTGHMNMEKGWKKEKRSPLIQRINNSNDEKENKKDISENHKIMDNPEDSLGDIQNLFDLECGYIDGIEFKNDECKNEIGAERKEWKLLNIHQKSEKANYDDGTRSLG